MTRKPANLAYKYRLKPTKEQAKVLTQMCGNNRFAWNMMLARQKAHYEETRRFRSKGEYLRANEALKELNDIKKDEQYSFLTVNPARCYDLLAKTLDEAWKKFFKERAKGTGMPRFKQAKGWDSFQTDRTFKIDYPNRLFIIRGMYIPFLCKDDDKLWEVINNEGYHKTITVKKSPSGRFYLSISLHDPEKDSDKPAVPIVNAVGLDWGVKDMIITSDGKKYPSIWNEKPQYRRLQKRLLRLQRKASRQYRMNKQVGKKWRKVATNNWRKTQKQCATIQQRLADMRKDYIHRITDELTEQYDAIFIEDLNVKGMTAKAKPKKQEDGKGYEQNGRKRKSGLSRNILQSSPGEIARQLEYKCNWRGKTFAKVGRFFPSSKTCSACGEVNKELVLKDRTWTCGNCGVEHDRDQNAAINIKVQGFQVLQKAKTA